MKLETPLETVLSCAGHLSDTAIAPETKHLWWRQTHPLHYESKLLLSEGSRHSRSADFLKDTAQPCWVPAILPSSVLELALLPSIYFTTGPVCFKVVLAWAQTAKENRQLPLCRTFSRCWPWGLDWQSCWRLLYTTTLHNCRILCSKILWTRKYCSLLLFVCF